jgi:hypothetical protein
LATKSPLAYHNYWGVFATPDDLPNVSGATKQDEGLGVGDLAWATSVSRMYQCVDSSAGAAEWRQDPRAIHGNVSGEIVAISPKASPTTSDLAMIEDAAASYAKKKATLGTLPYGRQLSAIHDNVAGEIAAITEKTDPVDADLFLIEDSEAADAKKKVQLGNLLDSDEKANLWFPPSSPHSEDDEFDSDTLDASWYAWNTTLGSYESLVTGLDTYDGSYSGDDIRYSLNPDERRSWLLMQGADAVTLHMGKTITFPTNLLIMARLKFNQHYSTISALDRVLGLSVYADSSGDPDANNSVNVRLNDPQTSFVYGRMVTKDGGVTGVNNYTSDVDAQGQALEYVAIHKIGTTYHGWIGTASGNWIYMGNDSIAATMVHVGIGIRNDTNNLPGLGVMGVDFIRFLETDNFLF